MIKKSELLDPASTGKLSEDPHNTGGVIEQTVDSKAVAKFGRPGDESDISGLPAASSKTAGAERGKQLALGARFGGIR
jgi:hypothetical protein